MKSTVRYAALIVLLVLSVACQGPAPGAPTTGDFSLPRQPSPPTNFPPLSGPSRTFVFHSELSYPVSGYTKTSRYVLYDNGAFALEMVTGKGHGEYTDTNGVIAFDFGGGGSADATGTLDGDLLTVRYSELMQHNDYEDAVYVLMP